MQKHILSKISILPKNINDKKFLSKVSAWYDNYVVAECVKLDASKFAVELHSVPDESDSKRLPSINLPHVSTLYLANMFKGN